VETLTPLTAGLFCGISHGYLASLRAGVSKAERYRLAANKYADRCRRWALALGES
jgi:hypothetical protein